MKTKLFKASFWAPVVLVLLFLLSCNDDDPVIDPPDDPIGMEEPEPDPDPEPTAAEILASERKEIIKTITADSEKVWRIASAQLKNIYGEFDVSNNFNIKDDELIFRNTLQSGKSITDFEGTLEWRRHNRLYEFAETQDETLIDDYVSPVFLSFDFKDNSSSNLSTESAEIDFWVNAEGKIEGTIIYEDAADDFTSLDVVLIEKLASDYKQVPTGMLEFTEAFTINSNRVEGGSTGMAGSLADNSIFIANRELDPVTGFNAEHVFKYDLDIGNLTNTFYATQDFVTKEIIPYNGKLLIAGGQRINTHELDLSEATSSPDYGTNLSSNYLALSRFGAAMHDDTIYLVGGQLDAVANTIYKYDVFSETVSEFATMPLPRFGARCEIVNNKLYAFGGTAEFSTPPATDTIIIYDFDSQSFTTETMPETLDYTFTGKIENLIYVAGRKDIRNATDNSLEDREPFIGVYDTNTGTFTALETNLMSPDIETIHSMAVFGDKIYIIYGRFDPDLQEGEIQTWSVLSADI